MFAWFSVDICQIMALFHHLNPILILAKELLLVLRKGNNMELTIPKPSLAWSPKRGQFCRAECDGVTGRVNGDGAKWFLKRDRIWRVWRDLQDSRLHDFFMILGIYVACAEFQVSLYATSLQSYWAVPAIQQGMKPRRNDLIWQLYGRLARAMGKGVFNIWQSQELSPPLSVTQFW